MWVFSLSAENYQSDVAWAHEKLQSTNCVFQQRKIFSLPPVLKSVLIRKDRGSEMPLETARWALLPIDRQHAEIKQKVFLNWDPKEMSGVGWASLHQGWVIYTPFWISQIQQRAFPFHNLAISSSSPIASSPSLLSTRAAKCTYRNCPPLNQRQHGELDDRAKHCHQKPAVKPTPTGVTETILQWKCFSLEILEENSEPLHHIYLHSWDKISTAKQRA